MAFVTLHEFSYKLLEAMTQLKCNYKNINLAENGHPSNIALCFVYPSKATCNAD